MRGGSRPVQTVGNDVSRLCLDWASNLENADSARRCRFRNSQQKRASDLDPTYVWIPKLDVVGSNPDPDLVESFAPPRTKGISPAPERTKNSAVQTRSIRSPRFVAGFEASCPPPGAPGAGSAGGLRMRGAGSAPLSRRS